MTKLKSLLLAALFTVGAAQAQPLVAPIGGDGVRPASASNPLPVTAVLTGTGAVTQSGTWSMQQSGTWTVQPGNTANTTAWLVQTPAVAQGSITNTATNIPSSSTAVTLSAASTHLMVTNNSETATLYVDLANGTATTGDFPIPPSSGACWDNLPAITTFKVIGSAADSTFGVVAY